MDPARAYALADVPMGNVLDAIQGGTTSLDLVAQSLCIHPHIADIVFNLSLTNTTGSARIIEILLQIAPQINVDTQLLRFMLGLRAEENRVEMLRAIEELSQRFSDILDSGPNGEFKGDAFPAEVVTCMGRYMLGDGEGMFELLGQFIEKKTGACGMIPPSLHMIISRIRAGDQDSVKGLLTQCLRYNIGRTLPNTAPSSPSSPSPELNLADLDPDLIVPPPPPLLDVPGVAEKQAAAFVHGFLGLSLGRVTDLIPFVSNFMLNDLTNESKVQAFAALLKAFVGNSKEVLTAIQPVSSTYAPVPTFFMGSALTILDKTKEAANYNTFAQLLTCDTSCLVVFAGSPPSVSLDECQQILDASIQQVTFKQLVNGSTDVGHCLGARFDSGDTAQAFLEKMTSLEVEQRSGALWGKPMVGMLAAISERQADVLAIATQVWADSPYLVCLVSLAADVNTFTPQDAKDLTNRAGKPHLKLVVQKFVDLQQGDLSGVKQLSLMVGMPEHVVREGGGCVPITESLFVVAIYPSASTAFEDALTLLAKYALPDGAAVDAIQSVVSGAKTYITASQNGSKSRSPSPSHEPTDTKNLSPAIQTMIKSIASIRTEGNSKLFAEVMCEKDEAVSQESTHDVSALLRLAWLAHAAKELKWPRDTAAEHYAAAQSTVQQLAKGLDAPEELLSALMYGCWGLQLFETWLLDPVNIQHLAQNAESSGEKPPPEGTWLEAFNALKTRLAKLRQVDLDSVDGMSKFACLIFPDVAEQIGESQALANLRGITATLLPRKRRLLTLYACAKSVWTSPEYDFSDVNAMSQTQPAKFTQEWTETARRSHNIALAIKRQDVVSFTAQSRAYLQVFEPDSSKQNVGFQNNAWVPHGYSASLFQDEEKVFFAVINSLASLAACTDISGPGKLLLKPKHAETMSAALGLPKHMASIPVLVARVAVKDNMTSRSGTCNVLNTLADSNAFPSVRRREMRALITTYYGDTACIGGIDQYAKQMGFDETLAKALVGLATGNWNLIGNYLPALAKSVGCMSDVLVGLVSTIWCLPETAGPMFAKLQLDGDVWEGIMAVVSADMSKARAYSSGLFERLKFTGKIGLNIVGLAHGQRPILKELICADQCPNCNAAMLEPAIDFACLMQKMPVQLKRKEIEKIALQLGLDKSFLFALVGVASYQRNELQDLLAHLLPWLSSTSLNAVTPMSTMSRTSTSTQKGAGRATTPDEVLMRKLAALLLKCPSFVWAGISQTKDSVEDDFAVLWASCARHGVAMLLMVILSLFKSGFNSAPKNYHAKAWEALDARLPELSTLYFGENKPTLLRLIIAFCSASFPRDLVIPRLVLGRAPLTNLHTLVRIAKCDISVWDDDEPTGPAQLLVADASSRKAARGICALLLSRLHVPRWSCPQELGVSGQTVRCLVQLAGGAKDAELPEDAMLFRTLKLLCRLCSIKNYTMLLYVATCLGELKPALEDLTSIVPHPVDVIASFFIACGTNQLGIKGFSAKLKVREETIREIFKVLRGDVLAVSSMMIEAYEDLPSDSGTQGNKAPKKLELGFDPKILIQITKLAKMDKLQLDPILEMLASKLKYFKREPSRSLVVDICINRDLQAISPQAQTGYDICTASVPKKDWTEGQHKAWLTVQTIRGNPGTFMQLIASCPVSSEQTKLHSSLLFDVVKGSGRLQDLIERVTHMPEHVVTFLSKAGIGSQYECFFPSDKVTKETHLAGKAIMHAMNPAFGPFAGELMQSLTRMVCRNARVEKEVLVHLQSRLCSDIDVLFNVHESASQVLLMSALVDFSLKRWRDGIPKLLEVLMCKAWTPNQMSQALATIRAVIPPFDLQHMEQSNKIISEFTLRHIPKAKIDETLSFLDGLYGILYHDRPFVDAVAQMVGVLNCVGAASRESIRATSEIIVFASSVLESTDDPIHCLKPIALKLEEFPSARVKALNRVIELLRLSDSITIFGAIRRVKAKLLENAKPDLFAFFDQDYDDAINFEEFNMMLNFYGISLSFDKSVTVFSKACKSKGYVDKSMYPVLYAELCECFIGVTLENMGFTVLNMTLGIVSLIAVLSMGLSFIYLGIQAFSNNSALGATSSSTLPIGMGAGVTKPQDMSAVKEQGTTAISESFASMTNAS